ncbi:hypothetical protein ACFYVR_10225 [Rhodococcus sp. NPDC003318]|uniref:hypothetical protein n=1 Tax=Rhodococcus sp. NPDC003318 TaxID=3364503 RepID=UPI0036984020
MTSGESVAAVLDRGAVGLRYFTLFVPRAEAVEGVGAGDLPTLYHAHRGVDLDAMLSGADALHGASAVLRAHLLAQEQAAARMAAAWTGVAADAALTATARRLDHGRDTCAAVTAAADALASGSAVIRDAVRAQAEFTLRLDVTGIGGRDVADIDRALAAAADGDAVQAAWLREVLVPHVRAHVLALTDLCALTTFVVDGVQRILSRAVDTVGPPGDETVVAEAAAAAAGPVPVVPVEPAPAVDPETTEAVPDADHGTLGFGATGGGRRDRAAATVVEPSVDDDIGAELADAGPL